MNIVNLFSLISLIFMSIITWIFIGLACNKILNSSKLVIVQQDSSSCGQNINSLPNLKRSDMCRYEDEDYYKFTYIPQEKPLIKLNFLLDVSEQNWLEICQNYCPGGFSITGGCEVETSKFIECKKLLEPNNEDGCNNPSKAVASMNNIPFYPQVVCEDSSNCGTCIFL